MRRLTIGIDLDDTLNNLISTLLIPYNQKYDDNLSMDDITDYKIHKFLRPECTNIFKEFAKDNLLYSLNPEPYSIEVLTRLNKKHTIYFVTAAHASTIRIRDKWLAKHFKFYSTGQLINCRDKHLLRLDVLVDDCIAQHGGEYHSLLYDKPWNRNSDINRVFGWLDVEREIKKLEKQ